ncbi:hypothetical protein, partial [Motilibacter deserti]
MHTPRTQRMRSVASVVAAAALGAGALVTVATPAYAETSFRWGVMEVHALGTVGYGDDGVIDVSGVTTLGLAPDAEDFAPLLKVVGDIKLEMASDQIFTVDGSITDATTGEEKLLFADDDTDRSFSVNDLVSGSGQPVSGAQSIEAADVQFTPGLIKFGPTDSGQLLLQGRLQ